MYYFCGVKNKTMALGRKKVDPKMKIVSVPCNCYLAQAYIDRLGGAEKVREVFQKAGNEAIKQLLENGN